VCGLPSEVSSKSSLWDHRSRSNRKGEGMTKEVLLPELTITEEEKAPCSQLNGNK